MHRNREKGQAIIELVMSLVAIMAVFLGVIFAFALGKSNVENIIQCRGTADSYAGNGVAGEYGSPIVTWTEGGDGRMFTNDDVAVSGAVDDSSLFLGELSNGSIDLVSGFGGEYVENNFAEGLDEEYSLFLSMAGMTSYTVVTDPYDNEELGFAVKVLPRDRKNDTYLIEALLTEAKICWQLGDHQHLNKVIDFGRFNNEYYAVFEYIEGTRLDLIIDSPIKRPEKQVILWGMQVLSAEQHMFDKGFLFRDLKPQNIMIDKNGNVKLFDFGLAMPIDNALNDSSDQIQGSPYYMPPERIVGAGESQHSEIYSLGMVLFHILAKQPYYSAEDIKSLVTKHVVSLRVNTIRSKLPHLTNSKLIAVIEKMIARVPERRYLTYKDAAAELFKIYKEAA